MRKPNRRLGELYVGMGCCDEISKAQRIVMIRQKVRMARPIETRDTRLRPASVRMLLCHRPWCTDACFRNTVGRVREAQIVGAEKRSRAAEIGDAVGVLRC